jgi:hypothetical protein
MELLYVIGAALIAWLIYRSVTMGRSSTGDAPRPAAAGKRVRLTGEQIAALTSASSGASIYGENRSMRTAQMPNGGACYDLRTIESLVKRGYLVSDEKGGYRITDDGLQGLRSGMGF